MATDEPDVDRVPLDEAPDIQQRPQLRLHHLFTLTAVAAVLFAIYGPADHDWGTQEFTPDPLLIKLMTPIQVLYVLITAVAITAVAYGIYWRRMGLHFFDEPGHWLLVEIAVVMLLAMVPTIGYRWIASQARGGPDVDSFAFIPLAAIWLYSLVFVIGLPIGLNIYFGRKKCSETRWRVVFYLKAAAKLLFFIGDLFVLPSLLLAARRDRLEGIPRDPGHWCGVAVQASLNCLNVLATGLSFWNVYRIFSQM